MGVLCAKVGVLSPGWVGAVVGGTVVGEGEGGIVGFGVSVGGIGTGVSVCVRTIIRVGVDG